MNFVSVKEYLLNYGHYGTHIKIIRTRFNDIIFFKLIKINLLTGETSIEDIQKENVKYVFNLYYPELFDSDIDQFKEGML